MWVRRRVMGIPQCLVAPPPFLPCASDAVSTLDVGVGRKGGKTGGKAPAHEPIGLAVYKVQWRWTTIAP